MNTTQKNIKLKNRGRIKQESIEEEKYVFRFTDRYIRKKTTQAKITSILVPIVLFLSLPVVVLVWNAGSFISILWLIYIFALIFLLIKHGMNRIYGDDIIIENNKIFYRVFYKGYRGHMGNTIAIGAIKKVEVRKSKIMIYGRILSYTGSRRSYKLRIPKEIENVDEFIQMAESLIGKE